MPQRLGTPERGGIAEDPFDAMLASAPRSPSCSSPALPSPGAVRHLAERQGARRGDMRRRLLVAMASSPRRSSGEPTEHDWRR
ncbi:MAG: hypothetical protein ACLQCU_10270, partial [Acidimicrobiales bacterium]